MKLGDAKPQTRGEHSRLDDLVELVKLKGWVQLRILPNDIISYKQHWINILASKTKREVKIPKMCLSHNPFDDGTPLKVKCPYCEIESQGGVSYLVNVVVRSLQEDAPSKIRVTKAESASGFKDPNSESWTPVRVLRVTGTLMKKIIELKALNKHVIKGVKKTFDVNHERYGVDLNIKYDENAKGGDKYQVNISEKSALTEEEKAYLVWELSEELIDKMGRESLADAKKELSRMQIVGAEEFDEGDEDEDEDDLGSKKKKPAPKKKGGEFFDEDEDDEDDEPAPKKKAPAKKKPVEDDEDDEDFDDEDDEPAPKKKATAKKPAPKKKSSRDEDDEDDDDFDEDEDDEDDEPAPKRKAPAKKAPAKKSSRDEDDDEDEDDDDFDDEDDEPAPKRKAPAKKPVGKKAPPPDDEDDDEDFDEDEDDEDDEPAPKRKAPAKKPAAKKAPAKKRSSRDEDDEEDDDDVPF